LSAALVLNTVSALISRQIPQIGAMKAIGASRGQISRIYLRALLIYGLAALLIGSPLAWIGARAFTGLFARMGNFDVLSTQVPAYIFALEATIALLIPVVAGLIPIYFGTRLTVRQAISDQGTSRGQEPGSRLGRITSRPGVIPSRWALAVRNTFRRRSRLALTLLTLSLSGMIFIAVLSVRDSLFASFGQALRYYGYDISVEMAGAYGDRQMAREALRLPGVDHAETWWSTRAARVLGDGQVGPDYSAFGVPAETSMLTPLLVEGRWLNPRDRAQVVVNTDFLGNEPDVTLGDTLTLRIGGQEGDWEIVGFVTNQYSGPVIYMPREELVRALGQPQVGNRLLLSLGEDASQAQVSQRLEARLQRAGFEVGAVTTRAEFVETFEMRFNFLIIFLLFLAALLAFVGALSLAGTMGLNVMERIREIGVMRAIGASESAIRWIVVAEGLGIGLISWLLAAALALPLSRLMSDGVGLAFGGERLLFRFSQPALFIWLALAMLIAFGASYLPARDASRKSIREVLSYE
jgi:putative ABC transport system permease protein